MMSTQVNVMFASYALYLYVLQAQIWLILFSSADDDAAVYYMESAIKVEHVVFFGYNDISCNLRDDLPRSYIWI